MEEDIVANKELICKIREEINNKICAFDEHTNECKKVKHIVIIDDDDISNFVTMKTLECYNIADKITVFDRPLEALNYLKTNENPDIILLDIKMPLMNGFEFIEEFNKLNSKSIIILLSSSIYSKDKDKAKENGVGYMSKPLKATMFQQYL